MEAVGEREGRGFYQSATGLFARRSVRCLIYFLAFLLILEALVTVNISKLQEYDPAHVDAFVLKPDLYLRQAPWNLAFIGTSRTDHNYNPELINGISVRGTPVRKTFNFGVGGGVATNWFNIKTYMLDAGKLPDILVYETYIEMLNEDQVDGNLNPTAQRYSSMSADTLMKYYRITEEESLGPLLANGVGRVKLVFKKMWKFYAYKRAIEYFCYDKLAAWKPQYFKRDTSGVLINLKTIREVQKKRDDGYAMTKGADRKITPEEMLGGNALKFHPGAMQRRFLEDSIDRLKERGVTVVLVDVPAAFSRKSAEGVNSMREEYSLYFTRLAAEKRIPFIDTRKACALEYEDFRDTNHLNSTGSRKFSKCVANELAKLK